MSLQHGSSRGFSVILPVREVQPGETHVAHSSLDTFLVDVELKRPDQAGPRTEARMCERSEDAHPHGAAIAVTKPSGDGTDDTVEERAMAWLRDTSALSALRATATAYAAPSDGMGAYSVAQGPQRALRARSAASDGLASIAVSLPGSPTHLGRILGLVSPQDTDAAAEAGFIGKHGAAQQAPVSNVPPVFRHIFDLLGSSERRDHPVEGRHSAEPPGEMPLRHAHSSSSQHGDVPSAALQLERSYASAPGPRAAAGAASPHAGVGDLQISAAGAASSGRVAVSPQLTLAAVATVFNLPLPTRLASDRDEDARVNLLLGGATNSETAGDPAASEVLGSTRSTSVATSPVEGKSYVSSAPILHGEQLRPSAFRTPGKSKTGSGGSALPSAPTPLPLLPQRSLPDKGKREQPSQRPHIPSGVAPADRLSVSASRIPRPVGSLRRGGGHAAAPALLGGADGPAKLRPVSRSPTAQAGRGIPASVPAHASLPCAPLPVNPYDSTRLAAPHQPDGLPLSKSPDPAVRSASAAKVSPRHGRSPSPGKRAGGRSPRTAVAAGVGPSAVPAPLSANFGVPVTAADILRARELQSRLGADLAQAVAAFPDESCLQALLETDALRAAALRQDLAGTRGRLSEALLELDADRVAYETGAWSPGAGSSGAVMQPWRGALLGIQPTTSPLQPRAAIDLPERLASAQAQLAAVREAGPAALQADAVALALSSKSDRLAGRLAEAASVQHRELVAVHRELQLLSPALEQVVVQRRGFAHTLVSALAAAGERLGPVAAVQRSLCAHEAWVAAESAELDAAEATAAQEARSLRLAAAVQSAAAASRETVAAVYGGRLHALLATQAAELAAAREGGEARLRAETLAIESGQQATFNAGMAAAAANCARSRAHVDTLTAELAVTKTAVRQRRALAMLKAAVRRLWATLQPSELLAAFGVPRSAVELLEEHRQQKLHAATAASPPPAEAPLRRSASPQHAVPASAPPVPASAPRQRTVVASSGVAFGSTYKLPARQQARGDSDATRGAASSVTSPDRAIRQPPVAGRSPSRSPPRRPSSPSRAPVSPSRQDVGQAAVNGDRIAALPPQLQLLARTSAEAVVTRRCVNSFLSAALQAVPYNHGFLTLLTLASKVAGRHGAYLVQGLPVPPPLALRNVIARILAAAGPTDRLAQPTAHASAGGKPSGGRPAAEQSLRAVEDDPRAASAATFCATVLPVASTGPEGSQGAGRDTLEAAFDERDAADLPTFAVLSPSAGVLATLAGAAREPGMADSRSRTRAGPAFEAPLALSVAQATATATSAALKSTGNATAAVVAAPPSPGGAQHSAAAAYVAAPLPDGTELLSVPSPLAQALREASALNGPPDSCSLGVSLAAIARAVMFPQHSKQVDHLSVAQSSARAEGAAGAPDHLHAAAATGIPSQSRQKAALDWDAGLGLLDASTVALPEGASTASERAAGRAPSAEAPQVPESAGAADVAVEPSAPVDPFPITAAEIEFAVRSYARTGFGPADIPSRPTEAARPALTRRGSDQVPGALWLSHAGTDRTPSSSSVRLPDSHTSAPTGAGGDVSPSSVTAPPQAPPPSPPLNDSERAQRKLHGARPTALDGSAADRAPVEAPRAVDRDVARPPDHISPSATGLPTSSVHPSAIASRGIETPSPQPSEGCQASDIIAPLGLPKDAPAPHCESTLPTSGGLDPSTARVLSTAGMGTLPERAPMAPSAADTTVSHSDDAIRTSVSQGSTQTATPLPSGEAFPRPAAAAPAVDTSGGVGVPAWKFKLQQRIPVKTGAQEGSHGATLEAAVRPTSASATGGVTGTARPQLAPPADAGAALVPAWKLKLQQQAAAREAAKLK